MQVQPTRLTTQPYYHLTPSKDTHPKKREVVVMPAAPNDIQLEMAFAFTPRKLMHWEDIFGTMIATEKLLCGIKEDAKPYGFSRTVEYVCGEHSKASVRLWYESRTSVLHNYMVKPFGADHFHVHTLYDAILVIPTWMVCIDPDFISETDQPTADRLKLNDVIGTIEKHFYEVMAD